MKIISDPVYGFINITSPLVLKLIEHPYIQRLRQISQLGLTSFVYPGAVHTRFQHALGSYHLMNNAIEVLRKKGHDITKEESEAANMAILLHDIGHAPFSHVLEKIIIPKIKHEEISSLMIEELNKHFDGKLSMVIDIYKGVYKKSFLCQLISGQIDIDRLDYLKRDSFFCGVPEGFIGVDRIIKMMNVKNNQLVIDNKGIYSVEKFLVARRFMFWQVYLHKTVVSADQLLRKILDRARFLFSKNNNIELSKGLSYFFKENNPLKNIDEFLKHFVLLDDIDIYALIKKWIYHEDKILSSLSQRIVNRKLFKIEFSDTEFKKEKIESIRTLIKKNLDIHEDEIDYFFIVGKIAPKSYSPLIEHSIDILFEDGSIKDMSEVSVLLNIEKLLKSDTKYYLCYPKEIDLK